MVGVVAEDVPEVVLAFEFEFAFEFVFAVPVLPGFFADSGLTTVLGMVMDGRVHPMRASCASVSIPTRPKRKDCMKRYPASEVSAS
jgi:hypothetical protein